MSVTTATATRTPHARLADPYRVLFDQLRAGAAHCRLTVERDQVVAIEVVDHNRAFDAFRDTLPRLSGLLTRMRERGQPEMTQIRGKTVLAVSALPVGVDGTEAMVMIEDVTVREQLEQRSRESQNRFEQAFHGNAAAMVIATRSDLRIIDVNARWLEVFGATRAEVIGRTSVELGLISESRAAARIVEHKQFTGGHDVELDLTTRSGVPLTVLASAKPIELAEGTCTLTTLIDITDRKRAEELETSNRDLEAFSSSVSHDLRAPLRAITGFSEILLDDFAADLPAEARDLLVRIRASGVRLRQLVDELLAFARLGRDALVRTWIELDPLVRAVLDEVLAGRALGDRLDLRVAPLGACHADPTLLRAVWTNLIDNALKYSQTRARVVIEIGREVRGSEVVYHVRDNGVGFDMKHADRLFGVFQRLHSATEFEGTGIGLANVRRILERHGGRITATSELDRGTTFEFTLGTETP